MILGRHIGLTPAAHRGAPLLVSEAIADLGTEVAEIPRLSGRSLKVVAWLAQDLQGSTGDVALVNGGNAIGYATMPEVVGQIVWGTIDTEFDVVAPAAQFRVQAPDPIGARVWVFFCWTR